MSENTSVRTNYKLENKCISKTVPENEQEQSLAPHTQDNLQQRVYNHYV